MSKVYVEPPDHRAKIVYEIEEPDGGWRRVFTDDERRKLRPMAETLAMLDGNAFFGISVDHYESYLTEADAVYRNNGGDDGWASTASWIQDLRTIQQDPTLKDAYDKLQVLIELKRKENGNI
jgi:hypothetical protein